MVTFSKKKERKEDGGGGGRGGGEKEKKSNFGTSNYPSGTLSRVNTETIPSRHMTSK